MNMHRSHTVCCVLSEKKRAVKEFWW